MIARCKEISQMFSFQIVFESCILLDKWKWKLFHFDNLYRISNNFIQSSCYLIHRSSWTRNKTKNPKWRLKKEKYSPTLSILNKIKIDHQISSYIILSSNTFWIMYTKIPKTENIPHLFFQFIQSPLHFI